MERRSERGARALLGVLAGLTVLAAARLAPIQDETYYWTWARSPGWSYVDHPPAVAWILAAAQRALGLGLAGLRVPTLAAIAATALFTALATARLASSTHAPSTARVDREGSCHGASEVVSAVDPLAPARAPVDRARAALLALLVLAGAPMFTIGYVPATPDPFQGAAAALSAWLVVAALDGSRRAAFVAGLVLIASVLTKHSSGVLAIGVLAGALAVPEGRRVLRGPHVWAGVACGLAVISPWLAADLTSMTGSVHFQHDRVLTRGEARGLVAIPVLAGGLVVALGPAGVVALARAWPVRVGRTREIDPPHAPEDRAGLVRSAAVVLGAGAWLVVASCLVPVWLGGGELNWSMPALVLALPAGAVSIVARGGRLERATRALAMLGAAVVLVLLTHVAAPFLPIRAAKDTTLRGAGFDALAAEVMRAADRAGAGVIATRRYQIASELRFHVADARAIVELGGARRSQYDLWTKPALCRGDVVLAVLNGDALPPELSGAVVGARTVFERTARAEVLDRWWLTPLRLDRDVDPTRCAQTGGAP
ncbi:glycosyltransferase family 39 protein [Myxococcota bacterium]|nr:glycosyltransferase family 39 protein [Myxococcota bacterium]